MTEQPKLVRDRIPAIIAADGRRPVIEVLSPGDYRSALLDKLLEESRELADADDTSYLDELADVYEVLRALALQGGVTMDVVAQAADAKAAERGGFDDRLLLVRVERDRLDKGAGRS